MKQAGSISFSYSPLGLRQSKQFSALSGNTKEWYIHDATGNIMCIYDSLYGNDQLIKKSFDSREEAEAYNKGFNYDNSFKYQIDERIEKEDFGNTINPSDYQ